MDSDFADKKVYINMPVTLLRQIDDLARRDYMSRSTLIRIAIIEYIRKPGNAALLVAATGEDGELRQILEKVKKEYPDIKL